MARRIFLSLLLSLVSLTPVLAQDGPLWLRYPVLSPDGALPEFRDRRSGDANLNLEHLERARAILDAIGDVELDDDQQRLVGLCALVAGQDVEPGDIVEEEYVAWVGPTGASRDGHLPPYIYRFADPDRAFGLSEYVLLVPPEIDAEAELRRIQEEAARKGFVRDYVATRITKDGRRVAADITRTFPVNGRFSPAQRAIYELVLEAQLAAIEEVSA